jgi:hypothetical protein
MNLVDKFTFDIGLEVVQLHIRELLYEFIEKLFKSSASVDARFAFA